MCGETNIRSAPLDINIWADFSNFDRSLFIVTSQISQIIQLSIILENPFGDWLWTIQSQSHIYVAEMAKRCLIEIENERFTAWSFFFFTLAAVTTAKNIQHVLHVLHTDDGCESTIIQTLQSFIVIS